MRSLVKTLYSYFSGLFCCLKDVHSIMHEAVSYDSRSGYQTLVQPVWYADTALMSLRYQGRYQRWTTFFKALLRLTEPGEAI